MHMNSNILIIHFFDNFRSYYRFEEKMIFLFNHIFYDVGEHAKVQDFKSNRV
jgi:hypothetical protein